MPGGKLASGKGLSKTTNRATWFWKPTRLRHQEGLDPTPAPPLTAGLVSRLRASVTSPRKGQKHPPSQGTGRVKGMSQGRHLARAWPREVAEPVCPPFLLMALISASVSAFASPFRGNSSGKLPSEGILAPSPLRLIPSCIEPASYNSSLTHRESWPPVSGSMGYTHPQVHSAALTPTFLAKSWPGHLHPPHTTHAKRH